MTGTPTAPPRHSRATRLELWKIALLLLLLGLMGAAGIGWLLWSKGRPIAQPVVESIKPAWMSQGMRYESTEPILPVQAAAVVDPTAGTQDKVAALEKEVARLRQEQEALKRRPAGAMGAQQAAKPPLQKPAPAPMLFIHHDVKEPEEAKSKVSEYTLAPGTKLLGILETAINSDVPGYFTCKVSTNVYDTATGKHLLVPQGSTILGHDQSGDLLYGNSRLPTIGVTLALPDGRPVDLGQMPITDQRGAAGLPGLVDNHWGRLLGAVIVGGALRGGQQAIQTGVAQAGGAGQVASGITASATQLGQQRAGRAMDTRPTITVDSGDGCMLLVVKPLKLQAMWK